MFNPWLTLSLNAIQMGFEVQSVIALRMLRLAAGGARMEAEATRMITEKAATARGSGRCSGSCDEGKSAACRRGQDAQGLQKTRTSQQAAAFAWVVKV